MARKDINPGQRELAAARRLESLELRKAGFSYRAIGAQLGVSEATAHKDVQDCLKALNEQQQEQASEYQRLELERLDRLWNEAWRQLHLDHVMVNQGRVIEGVVDEGGKITALQAALKVMDRRAKLLGLDAPAKTDVRTDGQQRIIVEYATDDQDNPTESA